MKRIHLIFILLMLAGGRVLAKEWRGIVPLHSTRGDVERLLGPPSMDRGDIVVYQTEREKVSVEYSKGPCNVNSWNVAVNTVLNIWISPKSLYISNLNLNLTNYEEKADPELPYIHNYVDKKDGVRYQVDESRSQTVTLIEDFPAAADSSLKCPSAKSKRQRRRR